MKRNSSTATATLSLSILLAFATTGCLVDGAQTSDEEDVEDNVLTFEEYKESLPRDPVSGGYVVGGDIVLHTDEALEEYFEMDEEQPGALAVYRTGGVDAVWTAAQALDLTYCVSTAFGSNHAAVVQAMASAASAWSGASTVKFVYKSAEDGNCTASNNNVMFDVRPTSGAPYLARAFFPNYARAQRNVIIDASSFGYIGVWTLAGILRHELGHALGFRHEHTRPQAGTCFEDSNWRALTPYDSASVMHYPQCNGSQSGDLVLTQKDKAGAASLYPATNAASWGWVNVSSFKANGKQLPWIRVGAGATVPMSESFSINPGAAGCPGCITQIVMGIDGGGKSCVYSGTGSVSSSASFSITAPAQKGVYEVWARWQWQYTCADALNLSSDGSPVAYVEVDSCAHDKCTAGGALATGCDNQCVTDICAVDPYCCNNAWDSMCVGEVASVCHQGC
jgi:serralysin